MNTNRLRTIAAQSPQPFSVRMPQMAADEKVLYIESVLDVLCESRYGPGYLYSYLDRPDHNAAEPVSFLDLIEDQYVPWYATAGFNSLRHLCELGELGVRKNFHAKTAKNHQRKFQRLNLAALVSNLSPSSLARGSPEFNGRTSSSRLPLRP